MFDRYIAAPEVLSSPLIIVDTTLLILAALSMALAEALKHDVVALKIDSRENSRRQAFKHDIRSLRAEEQTMHLRLSPNLAIFSRSGQALLVSHVPFL